MEANNKALREALDKLLKWVEIHTAIYSLRVAPIADDPDTVLKEKEDAVAMARAALAAPPRNCDLVEGRTADDEFEKAMGFPQSKTADERDNLMRENWFLFKAWLFDEAKGEINGSK